MRARLALFAVAITAVAVVCVVLLRTGRIARAAAVPKPVLQMDVIPRTPERLARGKYLVEGILQCTACHSELDFTHRPLRVVPGTKLGGHIFDAAELGMPLETRVVASNISSDPEYGAGNWKDVDFVRALRQGIGHDGRTLFPLMPYEWFRNLSDEDLASAIVYIRSLPPVHIKRPKTSLPEQFRNVFQPLSAAEHVPEPDRTDRIGYGKYLVNAGHCTACHTPHNQQGAPIAGMDFSGGDLLIGNWGPDPRAIIAVAALNLTPDASGLSYFDENMFVNAIRTGQVNARPLANIMPWAFFRNLTDDDLKAIFAYLQTLKPVKHRVDNTEPPTYCKLCQHKHGYGAMN
ncbi:MAG TPA: c-type cytochrome [Terriglobales bacterium]|nr:c-type cytochrome [Terriglobales bacterium]